MHYPAQEEHARFVQSAIKSGTDSSLVSSRILSSWKRCVHEYGLAPDDRPQTIITERPDLIQRQEQLAPLLSVSQVEMANLYQQIAGSGFAIMLTDTDGVVLHYVGDPLFTKTAISSGLQMGAIWTERAQGTNGIGTCLMEKMPLVVHRDEHFLSRNTILTCSAAPVFDTHGNVIAVLDASSESTMAQQHTMALVNMSAQSIENRLFLSAHRTQFTVRFHSRAEFVSTLGEGLIAFESSGRILSANRSARFQLGIEGVKDIIGRPIEEVFEANTSHLLSQARTHPYRPSPIRARRDGRRFYVLVQPADGEDAPRLAIPGRAANPAADSSKRPQLEHLNHGDPLMATNIARARRVMNSRIPMLLCGETGSGKDLFAKAVHNSSAVADKPFIAINCAAIPESLIESELFGYRPGAFTGASRTGSQGKIAQANAGTLFLDEIGDMPINLQSRLLRVLEEQEVVPLGGEKPIKVDFCLITATNRDLSQLINDGGFRQDLYYRLNGITLTLPPLRERTDLGELIRHLLQWDFPDQGVSIGPEVMEVLEHYEWPGNIRQLRNVLRTAVTLSENYSPQLEDFPAEMARAGEDSSAAPASERSPLFKMERNTIMTALKESHWNVTKAAKQLNVSRNTLYRKMKRHGITPPR